MRHQPHVYVPGPWPSDAIEVSQATRQHLEKVLRYGEGRPVTYTDGAGIVGAGRWVSGSIERGAESAVSRPSRAVTLVVAPPKPRDRQRFVVEKLQELGVASLAWVMTERSEARAPRPDRARAWAVGALEQSRGAWLMDLTQTELDELGSAIVADGGGTPISDIEWSDPVIVVIGPEGGLSDKELEQFTLRASLGPTVLRTETAAVVAAARIL